MSCVTLRSIRVENFGRFYDPAELIFNDRISTVVLEQSKGKTTIVNALEFLSEIVLEGRIKCSYLNYCNTYPEKSKGFVGFELLIHISDSSHNGEYRYGIKINGQGILEEYLIKESTQRRIFYRNKNHFELNDRNDEILQYVTKDLNAKTSVMHLLCCLDCGIYPYFTRFFQRLWIIRVGSINSGLSASQLFKSDLFTKRQNVKNCCNFMRMIDPTVRDMTRVPNSSVVSVIHKSPGGYDYPVSLSKESDTFIKFLALYRAIDALSTYGGLIIMDVGDFNVPKLLFDYLKDNTYRGLGLIVFTFDYGFGERMYIKSAENVGF